MCILVLEEQKKDGTRVISGIPSIICCVLILICESFLILLSHSYWRHFKISTNLNCLHFSQSVWRNTVDSGRNRNSSESSMISSLYFINITSFRLN